MAARIRIAPLRGIARSSRPSAWATSRRTSNDAGRCGVLEHALVRVLDYGLVLATHAAQRGPSLSSRVTTGVGEMTASRCDQLRAQELELSTELERINHLRGVMAEEEGHSEHVLTNLADELQRLNGHLAECMRQILALGC
jgi:hypothetical protein